MANLKRVFFDLDFHHPFAIRILSLVLVAVGYALSPALVVWVSLVFPGPGQVVVRSIVTAVLLMLFLLSTTGWPQWKSLLSRKSKYWFSWYLLALPFGQFLFVLAMLYGGINAGPAALFYLSVGKIVVTYLLKNIGSLFRPKKLLADKWARLRFLSVAMAVVAVGIYSWPNPLMWSMPMLAAMGAGTIEAISSIAIHNQNKGDNPQALVFYRYGAASFVSIVFVLVFKLGPLVNLPPTVGLIGLSLLALLVVGMVQAFIGLLELYAYSNSEDDKVVVPEDMANVILTTELIFGVIFSVVLINNVVGVSQLLGLGMILLAAVVAAVVAAKEKEKKNPNQS